MRIEIAMTKMKDMYDVMSTVIEYIKDCGITQCRIHKTPLSYIALPEHDLIIYFRTASLDKIRGLKGDYYYTDSYECDEYLKYHFTKEIREIIELRRIIADQIKNIHLIPNICKNCTGNSNLRTNNSFIDGAIYAADKFVQKLHEYNSEKYFDCLTNEDILKLRNNIIEEVKEVK